jgi:hypothetical protein
MPLAVSIRIKAGQQMLVNFRTASYEQGNQGWF